MELFSPLCRCVHAAAKSCCLCYCFQSPFPLCNRWLRPLASFSPGTAPPVSGSCCFSPTMWCLLLLVWHYSKPCCRQNETRVSHSCDPHRFPAGLRLL